jgi:hypothetical protein
MQFDPLKRRDFITLLGGGAVSHLRRAVITESIWLRSLGRLRDLLLSLLEQRKGFIDDLSETACCGWTATQVRRYHDVDFDAFALWQNRVCRQFDLNSANANAECRDAVEVNEGCELGASGRYSYLRHFGV